MLLVNHKVMLCRQWMLLLIISFALLGCTAGTAITGAGIAYDHYRFERSMTDRYILLQANHLIYRDVQTSRNTDISVTVFDKTILLTGHANNQWYRQQAEKLLSTIPKIKHIYNFIAVRDDSMVGTAVGDHWISVVINSKFIVNRDLDLSNVKVVTDNSNVYLLGIVTDKQANIAINIARKTAGVKHVITMFEYVRVSLLDGDRKEKSL